MGAAMWKVDSRGKPGARPEVGGCRWEDSKTGRRAEGVRIERGWNRWRGLKGDFRGQTDLLVTMDSGHE